MIASNLERPKLFEFNRLTRFYGTVIGVNDITLDLPIGAYGLVGPNGAGKTTLIDLITGALRPSLGSIRVLGESPQTSRKVVSEIGICPARDLLQPRVSARVWVRHLLQVSGYKRTEADRLACESLEQVGLANAMDRPIGTYSLGMRQRAKVAQAIAHHPTC